MTSHDTSTKISQEILWAKIEELKKKRNWGVFWFFFFFVAGFVMDATGLTDPKATSIALLILLTPICLYIMIVSVKIDNLYKRRYDP